MSIRTVLEKLIDKKDLTKDEMEFIMQQMLDGKYPDVEIAALLIALRCKGESISELIAAVNVSRKLAKKIDVAEPRLIDIVGTGGDALQTFNISTACCFIVAAAGVKVAKHGNRSVSGKSGAADVLEKAGVDLNGSPEDIAKLIKNVGLGFMFAPKHHGAMAHVASVRQQLGVRTIFNLMGPLTNPANAKYHLIGVYDKKWLIPFAEVLRSTGSQKALIVHGDDGLDEVSLAAKTWVAELSDNEIKSYEIFPEQFGIPSQSLKDIQVKNASESLSRILGVFNNEPGPARDIVLLNAAAALYAADRTASIEEGIDFVRKLLDSGVVLKKFREFVDG